MIEGKPLIICSKQGTLTGNVVDCYDAIGREKDTINCHLNKWISTMQMTQEGSGTPSPSNIRTLIGGWSRIRISHTQKNIWGGWVMLQDFADANISGATFDYNAGTVTYKASNVGGKEIFKGPFKENTQYTAVIKCNTNRPNLAFVYTDGTSSSFPASTATIKTIVSTSGKTVAYIRGSNNSGTTTLYTNESGLFEGTIAASEFEAYNGSIDDLDFKDSNNNSITIYGGTSNELTNEVIVTHIYRELTGTENWARQQSDDELFYRLTGLPKIHTATSASYPGICSHFPTVTITTTNTSKGFYWYVSGSRSDSYLQFRPDPSVVIPDGTVTPWKNYLADQYTKGTPVQVYGWLLTPLVYSQASIYPVPGSSDYVYWPINMHEGYNCMYTNPGTSEIIYNKKHMLFMS